MKTYLHSLLKEEDDPIAIKYLEYIKNGFPESKAKKKKVLVVGAGMAGMVSASILKKSGHDVTIVEANTRVGGRIKTFRNGVDSQGKQKKYWEDESLYAEAGAMRLPDFHYLLMEYCNQLEGVELEPFYYESVDLKGALDVKNGKAKYVNSDDDAKCFPKKTRNSFLYVNYKQTRVETYKESTNVNKLLDYHLQKSINSDVLGENQSASTLLDAALKPLINFIAINPIENWPKIIEKFGEYSMRRFLKEHTEYSENAIEMIGVIQNLESRMSYDFIQSFIESNIIKGDTVFWQVKGGTDLITEAFFDQHDLKGITHLDTKLTDLYLRDGKVKISTHIEIQRDPSYYKKIGFKSQEVSVSEMEFDEVIVTIPFSAFRMVHVWPKFSQGKRKAIRELHYDAATKVLVEFKERWWEQAPYNIIGGGTTTDLPNRFIYYPSQDIDGKGHGLMLACYCWADDARKWDSMSHKDRYIYALDNIAVAHAPDDIKEQQRIKNLSVFNPDIESEGYVDKIKGAATVAWMQNPYAFGEAAIFSPGQLDLLQEDIEKTEWDGKAHFAGEHTSLKHAWIEGAIESGIRAALEVNETPVELNQ